MESRVAKNGNGAVGKPKVLETPAPDLKAVSGFAVKFAERSILFPVMDEKFYVHGDTQEVLDVIHGLADTEDKETEAQPQNLLLTGPQGCGKTELGIWFAAKYKRPCLIMNCATIRETKDWFGFRDAKAGSIFWHKSDFVRALERDNCVVILDEFNRLHTTLHNSLYPLLDARRSSFIEELEEGIQVGNGTVFIATANIGFSHTGTHTLDSAIEDRFGYRIDIDFPTQEKESEILFNKTGVTKKLAGQLAKFGGDIRKKAQGASASLTRAVSTRQLLQTAILMKKFKSRGLDLKKAMEYTILPFYSKEGGRDSEQAQVLQLVQGIFVEE